MKVKITAFFITIWNFKPLWTRALLCWAVGVLALFLNQNPIHDSRFKLRGEQEVSKEISLILIDNKDWQWLKNKVYNTPEFIIPPESIPDELLWDAQVWEVLLKQLQKFQPISLTVNIAFPDSLDSDPALTQMKNVFWSAKPNKDDRISFPPTTNHSKSNIGILNIDKESDGIVRNFSSHYVYIPHIALKTYNHYIKKIKKNRYSILQTLTKSRINFRGDRNQYKTIVLKDLFSPSFDVNSVKNKIILIGKSNQINQTPLGLMSETEIIANIIDNFINNQWITNQDFIVSVFILFLLSLSTMWIIAAFPQTISFVYFLWIGTLLTAISLWLFDEKNYWSPILAPITQLSFTYIVFINYLLNKQKNENWMLEKESKYLKEIEELKNNFVSLISHDLKTPIAKIHGICDRMLSENITNEVKNDISLLKNESIELNHYIESILRITKLEAQDLKLSKEPTDINELIEEVVKHLTLLAKQKNIKIFSKLEPMFLIDFDPLLIREVIINLIENAIKYSKEGTSIMIKTFEEENKVCVSVKDNGPGISKENQSLVFNKFYRASEFKNSTKGSGLGLYLVKYFIELHEGNVSLKSELNNGTEFIFSLPID